MSSYMKLEKICIRRGLDQGEEGIEIGIQEGIGKCMEKGIMKGAIGNFT